MQTDREKRREERRKRRANRKPFKETKVGKFLAGAGSTIVDIVGEIAPEGSVLDNIAGLISKDKTLTEDQKEIAFKLLEIDKIELQAVSDRWGYDMNSDSWLSKNIRPLVLAYLVFSATVIIVLDSAFVLDVADNWVGVIEGTLTTVIIAYFGSRGVEKIKDVF